MKVEGATLAPVADTLLKLLPEEWRGKMWGFHPQQGQGRSGSLSLTRPRIQPVTALAVKATDDFRYSAANPFYRLTPQLTLVQDGSVITNAEGKVFGVAVYDIANEVSLVYPLKRIQGIVAKIKESKESLAYGWLGATSRDLPTTIPTRMSTPKPAPDRGVWIDGVFPDSPAETAGIKVKDLLLSINDRPIETRAQMSSVLRQLPPDSEITIRLKRESEFKVVKAKLAPLGADSQQSISKLLQRLEAWKSQLKTLPNTDPEHGKLEAKVVTMDAMMKSIIASPAPPEVKLKVLYGLEFQPMTESLRQHFGAPHGVLVATVNEGSSAARAGLKAGDIITQIGENKVTDQAGLLQSLDAAANSIQLTVLRRRAAVTLAFNR
ncbi:MAG: PDZ domain-containing protein [Acidobacteria bacterium]|nr:PDZ domain-containing protein [Acidobacteriota bacterium]